MKSTAAAVKLQISPSRFDFHAGKLKRAPVWMRETGLEWFYRLMHEPTRLWRRYLVYGSIFLWNVGLELTGLKKLD